MIWAILSALVAIAPFAVWGIRAYLARAAASAIAQERQAGADANQVEANSEEANRINRAAAAGAAADKLPIDTPDPYNLDK